MPNNEAMLAYFQAVAPFESVDLHAAVDAFLTGSAPGLSNPNFAPSAPLVGTEVRRQLNLRLDREARAAKPSLPPPDVERTPEAQQRVKELMEQTVANLKSITAEEDAEQKERRKRRLLQASDRPSDLSYRISEAYRQHLRGDMDAGWDVGNGEDRDD